MISAILLAAGASRRFGPESKLLAQVAGEPMIRRIARAVRAGGARDVIAVTGAYPEEVRSALAGEDVRFIHCERWAEGMGCSIAAGMAALSPETRGAFVVLGDMPQVSAREIAELIRAFEAGGEARVVVPVDAAGVQGNPVLWPRRFFPQLAALHGDRGAKALIAALAPEDRRDVAFTDAAVFSDIDTALDLSRFNGDAA